MTGRGHIEWDSHLWDQRIENYEFLLSTGMHPDRIARRLGVEREALDRMIARRKERDEQRQQHPVEQAAAGEVA